MRRSNRGPLSARSLPIMCRAFRRTPIITTLIFEGAVCICDNDTSPGGAQYEVKTMKTIKLIGVILVAIVALGFGALKLLEPKSIYEPDAALGITAVPPSAGQSFFKAFDRYTSVMAPNGKPINIVAQSQITNEQIVRARSILEHYLTDYPGSAFGSDKTAIANAMADNNAFLTLMNGADGSDPLAMVKVMLSGIFGQSLYHDEIQVEGHPWYIEQDYSHRDAAYEEILHFVHDYGIGVDGPNSSPGAAPEFQAQIRAAQINALEKKIWGLGASNWIQELTAENSLSQEYLAAVIDVYYGLWGADTENADTGMSGLYTAKLRSDIPEADPMGQTLMDNAFFHPYLTYRARIDASFDGIFSLRFDETLPYTHHAQYLKDIILLGNNDSSIRINELDNDIIGNAGNNIVIFSGAEADYTIAHENGAIIVTDTVIGRDGSNTLRGIEFLQFVDSQVAL